MKTSFPNKATQFSSTNQPKNNGRKKKIYTVLKKMGYSADDIKTALSELPFYSIKDLRRLNLDKKKPAIVRIIAGHILESFEDDDFNALKLIIDHVLGTPKQTIESDITTNGENINDKVIFQNVSEQFKISDKGESELND